MVYIDLSSRSNYKVVLRKSSISSAKIAETVQRKWLGRGGKQGEGGGGFKSTVTFQLKE